MTREDSSFLETAGPALYGLSQGGEEDKDKEKNAPNLLMGT